jgi:hypothetical protein
MKAYVSGMTASLKENHSCIGTAAVIPLLPSALPPDWERTHIHQHHHPGKKLLLIADPDREIFKRLYLLVKIRK